MVNYIYFCMALKDLNIYTENHEIYDNIEFLKSLLDLLLMIGVLSRLTIETSKVLGK